MYICICRSIYKCGYYMTLHPCKFHLVASLTSKSHLQNSPLHSMLVSPSYVANFTELHFTAL